MSVLPEKLSYYFVHDISLYKCVLMYLTGSLLMDIYHVPNFLVLITML